MSSSAIFDQTHRSAGRVNEFVLSPPLDTAELRGVSIVGEPTYWALRNRLGDRQRRQLRVATDRLLAPVVGSVRSTRSPTTVSITFDDGPDPLITPCLIDLLRSQEVECTFFLLVRQARKFPDLTRELYENGHEIALHGNDHRRITTLPFRQAVLYLRDSRDELEQISGSRVKIYRPPYGAQSLVSYMAVKRAGLEAVVWSADAEDWRDRPAHDVARDGMRSLDAGGILLLHERLEPDPGRGAPETTFDRIEMVRILLESVRMNGWSAATVGNCIDAHGAIRTAWFRP